MIDENDLIVENHELREKVRILDGENKDLKCQLKNKNKELISLRKAFEKIKKQNQDNRKDRFRNQKKDRR